MKYRKLDENGDYVFGTGSDFHRDTPEAVAQAVRTRLGLWQGEWFTDVEDGTPYLQSLLGKYTRPLIDATIRKRILGTQGVTQINAYHSEIDQRHLKIEVTLDTVYGEASLTETL
jgi:hypothetical protein